MRDAFGVQKNVRLPGITEFEGLPTRPKLKNSVHIAPEDSSVTPTPNEEGSKFITDKVFNLATASLRQALQRLPELTEASKHIIIVETKEGLNIELVDQDGTSMFPDGSKIPYERMRVIVQNLAGPLKSTPYRVSITGHTAANSRNACIRLWKVGASD